MPGGGALQGRCRAFFGADGARFAPSRGEPGDETIILETKSIRSGTAELVAAGGARAWHVVGNTAQAPLDANGGLVEHFEARGGGLEWTWIFRASPGAGPCASRRRSAVCTWWRTGARGPSVRAPAHGHLDGSWPSAVCLPDALFHGTDAFEVTLDDGTVAVRATVTIAVAHVNHAPVARAAELFAVEDTSLAFDLEGTDLDGDPRTGARTPRPPVPAVAVGPEARPAPSLAGAAPACGHGEGLRR